MTSKMDFSSKSTTIKSKRYLGQKNKSAFEGKVPKIILHNAHANLEVQFADVQLKLFYK